MSRGPTARCLATAAACLVTTSVAGADTDLSPIEAFRLPGPVTIDGMLDEHAWTRPSLGGFVQDEPDNGAPPVHDTEWWIAYDDDALYVALRMHDSAPDSIDTSVARRDAALLTDEVFLELDTFNDDRTGYIFVVGAGGYVLDAVSYNDGWWDKTWDAVWDSESRVDDHGWTAEMRIPFSQIRIPPADEHVWGVNIVRNCRRLQSTDNLFHRKRDESGHTSRFPDLVGIRGIGNHSRREITAYGVTKGEYLAREEGDPFNDGSELGYDVGADLAVGVTDKLMLNATLNPDFGQVEVDPAVVNLSDFETFFEEKRPFFVQDANTFRFGRDGLNSNWNFNWLDATPFYSRRIGRAPQLGHDRDADHASTPSGTTILGAAKLTGKVGGVDVGGLSALTAREHHELAFGEERSRSLAEPLTSYNVLRASRTTSDSRRAIGAMITATERDLEDERSRASLTQRAYTAGVDGWTYLGDEDRWAVKSYVSGSFVEGSPEVIEGIQRSSTHYFQRPDADHVEVDPDRTSLTGWMARIAANKQKGDYLANFGLGAISPEYETNDLGFQSRSDAINMHAVIGRNWREPHGIFRQSGVDLRTYWTWNFDGLRDGGGTGVGTWANLTNFWSVNLGGFYNPETPSTRLTRGGPQVLRPHNREVYLNVQTDSRKSWRAWFDTFVSAGGPGEQQLNLSTGVTLKPTSALKVEIGPSLTTESYGSQYVTTRDAPEATSTFGSRYVFADIEYREVAMSIRVDWSFTQRLTLQTYLQPLVAVGDYQDLKELREPGTFDFDVYGEAPGSSIELADGTYTVDPGDGGDTFTVSDPDFNFKSLRLNTVLRWEYSPGSTFYLVWTRNGTNFDRPGQLDLAADIEDVLRADSDDVVLVKVSRWFDF